jgi:hypothetical protein
MQLQPDIIASRIAQLVQIESAKGASINSPPSSSTVQGQDSSSSARTHRTVEWCRSRRIQSTWLRWKSYSFLVGRAWDIEICRSQQGWDFSISTYACVSSDSLVAKYTRGGNVEGLQQLFSRGEASPFTVCLDIQSDFVARKTLLEVSVISTLTSVSISNIPGRSQQRGLQAL